MKRFEFWLSIFCSMAVSVASAATGSSPEFRLDLRGLGPWQRRTAAATEALTYSSAWATNAANGAKAVVKVMPVLKTKPEYLVINLSGGTKATSYGISYLDEVPGGTWSDEYKTSKLVLRHIPAGSFIMGGRATDYPGAVNTNLHMVTITSDFYMGVFEVTQRQWELVMGTRPSHFSNELCYVSRPVEGLRWVDIRGQSNGIRWPDDTTVDDKTFLCELRTKTYLKFDLPTEAQWEFACRAGTHTALNSGKDLSATDIAIEMEEVGRYRGNSGWEPYKYVFHLDCDFGTDIVGMYIANDFGLYDMHGNVAEWCLDVFAPLAQGDMNPVGPPFEGDDKRVYRGGSWSHRACDNCIAGHRGTGDVSQDRSVYLCTYRQGMPNIGFRLCLQGGDLPDLASASTLVNESGVGSQSWTPTRSGAYYLTHSTMNGTTNVQLASAWFEVAGCTLALEPQGELTNGVMIAITGADEGWTVYYTTNGLAPGKASESYIGPFSLPESGTVRAVAYNEQGVASEEATTTFTLHDALSVVGAVAWQRYPWNGMVDVDLELKGDPEKKYKVEVEARDLDGGTNLPVKTVYVDAFVSNASDKDGSSSSDAIETIASTERARMKHEVWAEYAGVWHMNEDSGTAYDSTEHGLDAPPSCGTNELADVSQMVAYENGACGRARVNGLSNGKGGNYLLVPASRCFSCGGDFIVEGWFRVENQIAQETGYDDPRLVSLKPNHFNQETGFEIQFENGADRFTAKARTNSYAVVTSPSALQTWVKVLADYSGTNLYLYANGTCLTNQVVKSVLDDDSNCMAFGNNAKGSIWSLNGQYDEIRLRGGSLSAARIKADYDMIANRKFCTYGAVKKGAE